MRSILSSIGPLLAGVILLTFGVGLLGTVLGVRMAEAEFSPLTAGIVMAGYFFGQFVGTQVVHRWIETVGHIRTYAAFTAILSAATLAHPFAREFGFWAILRFLEGFCMAGLLLCVESWLNSRATRKTRGTILATYTVVFYGAYGVGQFMLYIPDVSGYVLYVLASILISIAAVPISLTRIVAPEITPSSNMPLSRLYAISPTGMIGSFTAGIVVGSFFGLASYYATAIGLSAGETANLMTVTILGGLFMQFPIGRLSDVLDRRKVIAGAMITVALAAVGIAVVGAKSHDLLLLLSIIFGGMSFTLYPLSAANTNDYADPGDSVATGRGLLAAYSAGAILGPLGGAVMIFAIAPSGLFIFASAVAAATFVFVVLRMRVREAPPADEQSPFQALPRTTPEVLALDPRVDAEPEGGDAA